MRTTFGELQGLEGNPQQLTFI